MKGPKLLTVLLCVLVGFVSIGVLCQMLLIVMACLGIE